MNKPRDKNYFKEYYRENNLRRRKEFKLYYDNIRQSLLVLLGNKCVKCGFSDPRALQVDHINGGGSIEKKKTTRTFSKMIIESVLKEENKYQLLCANCNWIKRYENHEVRK